MAPRGRRRHPLASSLRARKPHEATPPLLGTTMIFCEPAAAAAVHARAP